jgi:hypothetical protein
MEASGNGEQDQALHALIAEHTAAPLSHGLMLRGDVIGNGAAHKALHPVMDGGMMALNQSGRALEPRAIDGLQLLEAPPIPLPVSDIVHTTDSFLVTGLASAATILDLTKLQPEVLQWLEQCRMANGGAFRQHQSNLRPRY